MLSSKNPLARRIAWIIFIFLILVLTNLTTRSLEVSAWRAVRQGQPELNLQAIEGALGQGLVMGVLGGFRAILADFFWIRTNILWERRDHLKLSAMIKLVVTLDPRPAFFWINASRMIAYDVPAWRIREEGDHNYMSEKRQQAIDLEQSEKAFKLLDSAIKLYPHTSRFYIEKAQIYLNRLKDDVSAARWFLQASRMRDAPYFAARIYAELLRKQGKNNEAYEFLKNLYTELPDVPLAQKGTILKRIGELEMLLDPPISERFQP